MNTKIIAAALSMVAVAAFALSSTAWAATPELTEPTGTALATGAKVTGTLVNNSSIFWNTSVEQGLLECTSVTITGEVTKNKEGRVEVNITSAVFGGAGGKQAGEPAPECLGTINAGVTAQALPWCLRALGGAFSIRGGKCSEAEKRLKLTLTTTTIGNCVYKSTLGGVSGTYEPDITAGDAIFDTSPNGFEKIEGGILCSASFHLELSLTLETDEGTAKPIYVS